MIQEQPDAVLGPGREHVHRQRHAADPQPAAGAAVRADPARCRSTCSIPLIFGISIVGVYSVSGSLFDVWLLAGFGLLGYLMRKLDYPTAPLILGLVLGDGMERALRQSLMMSQGDLSILVSRPISAVMLSLAVLILLVAAVPDKLNAWRVEAADVGQLRIYEEES